MSADVQRIILNASTCITISGGRTEQLDKLQVFCHVTSFTSGFLSFIVVEHIRFFHGAIQFVASVLCHRTTYLLTIETNNQPSLV